MQTPDISISARVFTLKHICEDPGCDCQQDKFCQDFNGKWGLEVIISSVELDRQTTKYWGPFPSEDVAKECHGAIVEMLMIELKAQGYDARMGLAH